MTRRMRKMFPFVASALLLVLTGSAAQIEAGVVVRIGPPVITFEVPPVVVVIPGTYVYMVPDRPEDVLFYQGYWWRPYDGQWYRSRDYKGKWHYVEYTNIPRGMLELPPDYRYRLSPGHEQIHHAEVRKNWKKWEKEKHWDKKDAHDNREHGKQKGGH